METNKEDTADDRASTDTDNVSDYGDEIPPEIAQAAKEVSLDLLPDKSKRLYVATYNNFKTWRSSKKTISFAEEVFLAYFKEISQRVAPPTLWNRYSMLKTTVKTFDTIDISSYHQLIAYIKKKNAKYKKKKSRTFTADDISKFCNEAPDENHLARKVIVIFGILGAMRRREITNVTINDVGDENGVLYVKILETKNDVPRFFPIYGEFYEICKKYMNLRPTGTENHNRFFIHYSDGKCTRQPIGINTMGHIPKQIATWLSLPEPSLYTGHSFRRTSATLLVDGGGDITDLKRHGGWKSTTVAEGYIDESKRHKQQISEKITKAIVLKKIHFEKASNVQNTKQTNNVIRPVASTSAAQNTMQHNGVPTENVADENAELEYLNDDFDLHASPLQRDDVFRRPTDTQQATYNSPLKKRKRNCDGDDVE